MGFSSKVHRRALRMQAAFAGKAATDIELEAAVAMARTTRRLGAAIARELVLDPKTVQDWGNPESGDRGPHLVLAMLTEQAADLRPERERGEAFAALDFVEHYLGRVAFHLPSPDEAPSSGRRAQKIAAALVEFAEFVDAIDDAGHATPSARLHAHQQLQDVIGACQQLLADFDAQGGRS